MCDECGLELCYVSGYATTNYGYICFKCFNGFPLERLLKLEATNDIDQDYIYECIATKELNRWKIAFGQ